MHCVYRPWFQICFRILIKIKLKHVCAALATVICLDFFGVFTHVFEATYDDSFVYPYEGDVHDFVSALRHNQKPDVPPINEYNYTYIHDIAEKCLEPRFPTMRIILLVKSSVENFDRRMGIRNSWGFEKRYSDVPFKTVFLLGIHPGDDELRAKINLEAVKFKDIVQADFVDSYYNNTIKTMMGFKWAVQYCSNSKFFMFVDDDMYVSMKNVLRFLRNPAMYPEYLIDSMKLDKRDVKEVSVKGNGPRAARSGMKNVITDDSKDARDFKPKLRAKRATAKEKIQMRKKPSWTSRNKTEYFVDENSDSETKISKQLNISITSSISVPDSAISKTRTKRQVFDFDLPDDVRLFAGFVIVSAPHRHKTSTWYVPLSEYPYHLWPPYVTAGSYILSKEALLDMYYASMYTKHFRFDDIFLGLVSKKADIEPFHSEEFHFYKKDYTKHNYRFVISSHGYGNPEELLKVWNEQKAMGSA